MSDTSVENIPSLTIGDLFKTTGCKVETIRYYERIGLMPRPLRSAGGHRLYRKDDLKRLTFVRRCRELGFTLDEVRSFLTLVDSGDYTCAQVKAITLDHLADIRRKIADLRALARVLERTADLCDGGVSSDCPIVDTLYREPPDRAERPRRGVQPRAYSGGIE